MYSENTEELPPGRGRFQVTPGNRLFVFYHVYGKNGDFSENRVVEIREDNSLSQAIAVPLTRPFRSFFTATVRGGSKPSDRIDVFGEDGHEQMRYACVWIIPD